VRGNWGFIVLGIYLILSAFREFGMFLYVGRLFGVLAFFAGVLILYEQAQQAQQK